MGRTAQITLDRLDALSGEELRVEWARCFGVTSPNISADQLRLGIAYRLQEKRHGGISREVRRMLLQTSRAAKKSRKCPASPSPPRKLTPDTRLVRDWHGTGYSVTVLEKGFEYDGQTWRSLTAIAKAITGTHRNGPRFFGLTQ